MFRDGKPSEVADSWNSIVESARASRASHITLSSHIVFSLHRSRNPGFASLLAVDGEVELENSVAGAATPCFHLPERSSLGRPVCRAAVAGGLGSHLVGASARSPPSKFAFGESAFQFLEGVFSN